MNPHEHEKLTYQYMIALDEGDMDTVARILVRAENDPELERMILEINDALLMDEPQSQPIRTQKETTMPVFSSTKRKRGSQMRWTAVAAIFASILFVRFAIFVVTQPAIESYNAEVALEEAIDKAELTRQFLNAWNDNSPIQLDGLLTEDYRHSEIGTDRMRQSDSRFEVSYPDELRADELPSMDVVERIENLNSYFGEIHFFMTDINTTDNRLLATLTLKGLHRDFIGQELNYTSTGFINVKFEGDKISETVFTINIDDFIQRYGDFRDKVYEGPDLFAMPPADFDDTPQSQTIDIADADVKGMSLNINAGHVDLRIGSEQDTILNGEINNVGAFDYSEKGERIKIIAIKNHPYYLLDDNGESPMWAFSIGSELRTDLDVTIGNRDAYLALEHIDLQGLTLSMGNGSTQLNLPDTGSNYHVTVNMLSSLGKLELHFPDNVGLKIDAYDGIWQSRNYNHTPTVINLQLNGSLSALDMLGK